MIQSFRSGGAMRVVDHAYEGIADGMYVSFLLPADGDPPGA
jgi:hypothetical protein